MTFFNTPRVFLLLAVMSGQVLAEGRPGADAMEDLDLGELPETHIMATASPTTWLLTPGSGVVIQGDAFIALGGADFGDVAKYDPTVSAPYSFASSDNTFGYGQTGYAGYNIRGIEGNRILMLVDGIRQPEQFISTSFAQDAGSQGGAGRDYYDPAMFEATEILKGSASALYGSDAMGGVVSFRTPDATDFFTRGGERNFAALLRGQYFSHNESKATQAFFALRDDTVDMLFGYAGRWGKETENNGVIPANPADFDSQSYLLKFGWEPNAFHHLGVTLEHFTRNRFVDALSANKFIPTFDKEILNWEYQERSRASVSWNYRPEHQRWFDSMENQLYFQTTENNSRNHSESVFGRVRDQNIHFDTRILGLQSTFRKKIRDHALTYGLEYSEYHAENSFYRIDNGLPPFPNNITFAPSDTTRAALFIQDHWQPEQSRWEVIAGLRLDYYHIDPELSADYLDRLNRISAGLNRFEPAGELEQVTVSPRLDVIYKVNDDTSAYAQYAYGVRNPTAEELSMLFQHTGNTGSITLPNPDLEEEKSHAFELGIKQQTDTRRLYASAFWTRYKDFIENGVDTGMDDPGDGRDILQTVNRGSVDIYGFELGGSFQLGRLSSSLDGFELGLSTGRTWGIDRDRDVWLNSIEPWKSVIYIGYTNSEESFGARLTGTYVDGVKHVDETNGDLFRPPSYFTLDLSAYWRLSENVTLQAGINNILDEKYWQWSNTRRGGGHLTNASSIDDRSTAPGTNGFVSLTYRF